jgi:hypothetical protein
MAFEPLSFFAGWMLAVLMIGGFVWWKGEEIIEKVMREELMGMSEDISDDELGLDEVDIDDT